MVVFIAFDFDRTLADYSKSHGRAFLQGIPEIYKRCIVNWMEIETTGLTDMQIITSFLHNRGMSYHEIFPKLPHCMTRMHEIFEENLQTHPIELLDGVEETLEKLTNQGVLLGLATGNLEDIAWLKTENAGIRHYFSVGGFGSEAFTRTGVVRSSVEKAKKVLGLTDEDCFFHVGDTPSDMISALEAKVFPIGVTTGSSDKQALRDAGAFAVIEDLRELPEFFDSPTFDQSIRTVSQLRCRTQ